jgi:hypothetical protein
MIFGLKVLSSREKFPYAFKRQISSLTEMLTQPTSYKLDVSDRENLRTVFQILMKYWDDLPQFIPSSQEEIFHLMTSDSGVVEPFRSKMFECGAVQIRVHNSSKYISICGMNDFESFEIDFKRFFEEFGDPSNLASVLGYSGGFSRGNFQNDSLTSGGRLVALSQALPFREFNRTCGGFFHDDLYTYIVTAAHCLYGTVPVTEENRNVYAKRDESRDIAVFKIAKTPYMNGLFQDYEIGLHEFTKVEEFPFVNVECLEPGTEVVKLGGSSGFISGRFIGMVEVSSIENNETCKIKGVAVQ